jgi:hypothetical protein
MIMGEPDNAGMAGWKVRPLLGQVDLCSRATFAIIGRDARTDARRLDFDFILAVSRCAKLAFQESHRDWSARHV